MDRIIPAIHKGMAKIDKTIFGILNLDFLSRIAKTRTIIAIINKIEENKPKFTIESVHSE